MLQTTPPAWRLEPPQLAESLLDQLEPAAYWYLKQQWLAMPAHPSCLQQPFWMGSPVVLPQSSVLSGMRLQLANADPVSFSFSDRLASNRSWINEQTLAFYDAQALRVYGHWQDEGRHFVARALWPESWRLHAQANPTGAGLEQRLRDTRGGAGLSFSQQRLWQGENRKAPFVLGLMLNGAQGDDDEAHGGHFAVVMGALPEDGDIADLWVANYYNPDVVSEKGILPAFTPLATYMSDVNSGQQFYRPSCAVFLRLHGDTLLPSLLEQLARQMRDLYSHHLHYDHAHLNCTGITLDAMRNAGFGLPHRGATSRLLAPVMYLFTLLKMRDAQRAMRLFQYLNEERARLLPSQAFLQSSAYLMSLLQQRRCAQSAFERQLMADAVSLDFVHFPQIPSSRKMGREPLLSLLDFQQRVPKKRSDWQTIPSQARVFPAELRRP